MYIRLFQTSASFTYRGVEKVMNPVLRQMTGAILQAHPRIMGYHVVVSGASGLPQGKLLCGGKAVETTKARPDEYLFRYQGTTIRLLYDDTVPVASKDGEYWLIDRSHDQPDVDRAPNTMIALWSVQKHENGRWSEKRRVLFPLRELWESGLQPKISAGDLFKDYSYQCVLERKASGVWVMHVSHDEK